ncbi:ArsR family transcriptional regulator [Natrialba chahannaoensis JCM 10990]|uniref:ArsR family transcriptional regulator n=1 Tax=Natrialba chahannaoensis JCM 10990 TaxID=1227492 RepID=M0ANR3_9EURY|nr:metalloregulator ArsR/SmtB family transcription factor [Natrialba chahannaoensis]ELY98998.1 ArsR family transcriptional regulator [Natrialba chahannaoensis JCM 10990]
MVNTTDRLERYLEDELGECRSDDLEQRLAELETLDETLGSAQVDAELDFLSALANETRYRLVRVLVAARDELCVCELHAVVDITESGLSHALSNLVDAGVVESRKDGRWKKYRATNRAVAIVTLVEGTIK